MSCECGCVNDELEFAQLEIERMLDNNEYRDFYKELRHYTRELEDEEVFTNDIEVSNIVYRLDEIYNKVAEYRKKQQLLFV